MRGDVDDVKDALKRFLESPSFIQTLQDILTEKGDGVWPPLPISVYKEDRTGITILKLFFSLLLLFATYHQSYSENTNSGRAESSHTATE